MRVTAQLVHRCPYRDEVDEGVIELSWRTNGRTLELHALRDWLGGFAEAAVTHESLTDTIRFVLGQQPGIGLLDVSTRWNTAGMEIVCASLATPHRLEYVTP